MNRPACRLPVYDGQGTSYRRDGNTRQYEGTRQEGYWTGNGILYRPDGSISREGEWVKGDSAEYEWQEGGTCWDEEGSPARRRPVLLEDLLAGRGPKDVDLYELRRRR